MGDTRCKQRFKTPCIPQWEKKKEQEESTFKDKDFPPFPKRRLRSRSRASVRSTSRQRSGSRKGTSSRQRVIWAGVTDHNASVKKSKEAQTQNAKFDKILVMMRQLKKIRLYDQEGEYTELLTGVDRLVTYRDIRDYYAGERTRYPTAHPSLDKRQAVAWWRLQTGTYPSPAQLSR
ncbi:uncharacterized protein LOC120849891 isoform X2 [Ixodes scapularis]|uniref:uncharacterized protein LOC120849891 isoform X1 n=1 Tax=Ixodes scapularis TaxID=6945 RepID=UPI001A9F90B0|nr:uncharacterized protein LOC120849891 isoform X1 [Ixodes scapularis]XP_040078102.1 uncharacterized protein LOC120849891 isoform X2 [Ixodes scapularis]